MSRLNFEMFRCMLFRSRNLLQQTLQIIDNLLRGIVSVFLTPADKILRRIVVRYMGPYTIDKRREDLVLWYFSLGVIWHLPFSNPIISSAESKYLAVRSATIVKLRPIRPRWTISILASTTVTGIVANQV